MFCCHCLNHWMGLKAKLVSFGIYLLSIGAMVLCGSNANSIIWLSLWFWISSWWKVDDCYLLELGNFMCSHSLLNTILILQGGWIIFISINLKQIHRDLEPSYALLLLKPHHIATRAAYLAAKFLNLDKIEVWLNFGFCLATLVIHFCIDWKLGAVILVLRIVE